MCECLKEYMHIGDLRAGDMVDFHYIVESMYMYVILI